MIHLLDKKSFKKVRGWKLRRELRKQYKNLPCDFQYPQYGYFIVLENLKEIIRPFEAYDIDTIFIEDISPFVELVEEHKHYYEIVLILHADFGVSLIVPRTFTDRENLDRLITLKERL